MGRVWPRHGRCGRPLNSAVRHHISRVTDFFFLLAMFALMPFAIGIVAAMAVPGPLSKRITYGVVAGILTMVVIGVLRAVLGAWARGTG